MLVVVEVGVSSGQNAASKPSRGATPGPGAVHTGNRQDPLYERPCAVSSGRQWAVQLLSGEGSSPSKTCIVLCCTFLYWVLMTVATAGTASGQYLLYPVPH